MCSFYQLITIAFQMRRPGNSRSSAAIRKEDIENMKQIRSSEIFESIEYEREKSQKQADSEGKELFELWRNQGRPIIHLYTLQRTV